jgi:predicted RNase H-like HicB family nuclease
MYYPATFNPHEDGSGRYDVTFADLPGCVSQGDNLEHALVMAQEALTLHLSGMIKDEDDLPRPSSLEEARLSDETEAREEKDPLPKGTIWQYIVADVRQPAKKTPSVNVSISLKPVVIEQIDSLAEDLGLTRSGIIALAARDYVDRMRP